MFDQTGNSLLDIELREVPDRPGGPGGRPPRAGGRSRRPTLVAANRRTAIPLTERQSAGILVVALFLRKSPRTSPTYRCLFVFGREGVAVSKSSCTKAPNVPKADTYGGGCCM